jgi:hypothetical protein
MSFAFTEQGVSMLSAVLHTPVAISMSIRIIETFVALRKLITANTGIIQRLKSVEQKQIETDKTIDKIFNALESKDAIPKRGVFFNGQIFDAYVLANKIIKSAKQSITLIDNYIDLSHDRFLIIDDKDVYHLGASLKDLGKKWFAFSKMGIEGLDLLGKIKRVS